MKRIAIMQPYLFPYLGYLQLVYAVDKFVFYDDVNFIKRGWINRNRILLNGSEHFITIPCIGISQNRLINEVEVDVGDKKFRNLKKTIELAYCHAPYFKEAFELIETVFENADKRISEIAAASVEVTCRYLGLVTPFVRSSVNHADSRNLQKGERLLAICKSEGIFEYVNAAGGQLLYSKTYFKENGINLFFILPDEDIRYQQKGTTTFVPGLSTIDVLMHCSKDQIRDILSRFVLV